MSEWLDRAREATYGMDHGLVRVVAELVYGRQTARTARLARGWVRRRSHFTTALMVEQLAERIAPLTPVDKSPNIVYRPESLRRALRNFPRARFIHLLRHPRGHGESVIRYLRFVRSRRKELGRGPLPSEHWLLHLADYRADDEQGDDQAPRPGRMDPQRAWYALNKNIREFLEAVPPEHKMQVRTEDLLNDLDAGLERIAGRLGLAANAEAIDAMKHPERSPYACYGPPGARFGNDRLFLERPALRASKAKQHSLEGPLSWRPDGAGFMPEVVQMAREFGYQ
jgi:hypothetical protein